MGKPEKKLALGTVQFGMPYGIANDGEAVSLDDAKDILDTAYRIGIDTLDTAISYGQSETVLGRLDAKRFAVVSKLPGLPTQCHNVNAWVEQQVQASLSRLGIPRLSGLLLHRPKELLGPLGDTLYVSLCNLRDAGITAKIGVSVYDPNELEILCTRYDFDLIQAPLNILDTRLIESGWADRLTARGIELHARSVFLQGLLLIPPSKRPARFSRFIAIWQSWDDWLRETGLTPLQACLRYVLSHHVATKAVVGVDSVSHLREIVASAMEALPAAPSWPKDIPATLINPSEWNTL